MCKNCGETIGHLLLCEVERALWASVSQLLWIEWVMPLCVVELMVAWGGTPNRNMNIDIGRMAPLCLKWSTGMSVMHGTLKNMREH